MKKIMEQVTTTMGVLGAGKKVIFRDGYRTRPCFSQLKMRFAGAGNTPVPKNLFLGAGYALTRQIFDAGGCVLIVPDY